jgi:K+-dependent Na+/Ca+ exchanger-like protein
MSAILSLSVILIAIYILSLVTDEFFITSLDQISERWHLPPSVAGASLMAVGSSAPEFCIAMLSVFKQGGAHSDVGAGTIVGSAVFNILIITGVSAIVREAKITLPVIIRDTFFYLFSILILLKVFWDGAVTSGECLFFLGLYVIYLAYLFFVRTEEDHQGDEKLSVEKPTPHTAPWWGLRTLNVAVAGWISRVAGNPEKAYLRAFGVSILLIIILSWILVDAAVIFANAVGLPPVVVALTILAAGTSAPDLIASVVVARQGRGNMAVANAIGSNIFDILVCLGLPWLIATTVLGRPFVQVGTHDLLTSVFILISTVIVVFIFLYTDRTLSKKEGWGLVGLYAAYVVWTVMAG